MNPTNRLETILDDIMNGKETTLEPVNRLEAYLKLISQNGTGGGGNSWNNLKNKPFYDESVVYFERVDGYTPLDSIEIETGVYVYKVSNTPHA